MAAESDNVERVFNIPKQSFRQKVPVSFDWNVKLKAHDQFGEEEEHEWKLETSSTNLSNYTFLNFIGSEKEQKKKYEKFFCKIKVYDGSGAKLTTIKQNQGGVMTINSFNFGFVYCLGQHGGNLYGGNQCVANFANGIDLSFTIYSSDQSKSKTFEPQKTMLDKGILTDMTIKTKEKEFHCHKFVLAAESEYFRIMFETKMLEKDTNIVDWTDVFEAAVVEDLIHFFYTSKKPPNLKDNHFELIEAAHLCELAELKSICVKSLAKSIRVDNALRILQTADFYDSEDLKSTAVKFVVANCPQILATDGFRQMEPTVTSRLLPTVFQVVNKLNPKFT